VHAEGLDGALSELAGAPFVAAVRHAHADYGRVLGVTQEAEDVSLPNMTALLRAAQQRVGEYVLQVLASADSDDPASVAAAVRALRPPAGRPRRPPTLPARCPTRSPRRSPTRSLRPAVDPVVAAPRKSAPPPARPSAPPPARPSAPTPA
jgi:hypothetical protein